MHAPFNCAVVLSLFLLLPCWADSAESPAFPLARDPGDLLIDVGLPRSEPHLGFGWSRREGNLTENFIWIKHLEADIWFDVKQPVDTDVWMVAAPLYLAHRRQNIAAYVNDHFVKEWVCADSPGAGVFHALIPAVLLKEGRNRLILRMGYRRQIGRDKRELSLAVDRLLIRPRP